MRWLTFQWLALAVATQVSGLSYYVSPAGDDRNDCSSPASACREIRKALTRVAPGDSVLVADGTYRGFTAAQIRGLLGQPITIRALGPNAYVEATTDRKDNRDNIFITYCQYLVIDGLNSTNAPRAGVRVDNSPHITVRNGRFGNNQTWGIFTDFSDDLLIERNECFGSRKQHGIYVSNSGDRPVVRSNHSHHNVMCGIHMNGDRSAGGDGVISGALVENNIIHDNGTLGGAGINMDGVQEAMLRNNVLFNNHASGITMYKGDSAQGPKNNRVFHNTIDQADNGRWALLIGETAGPITVRNNIFHTRNNRRGGVLYRTVRDAGNTDSDYNAFGGACYVSTNDGDARIALNEWQRKKQEQHSVCADIEKLVLEPLRNYHLRAGAPAIDAGETLERMTVDIEMRKRPVGRSSDMGAYEFDGR